MLILVFSVMLPIFPISGRIEPINATVFHTQFYLIESIVTGQFRLAGELLQHLALPAVALALPLAAVIARVRSRRNISCWRAPKVFPHSTFWFAMRCPMR